MSDVTSAVLMGQAEEPSSPIGVFELPCGYLDSDGTLHTEVEMSEITGHQEDMMASRAVPPYKKMSMLLGQCVKRIGTITDKGRLAMVVSDLTVGDRAYLLVALRRVTLGNELPFEGKCPDCGKFNRYMVSLADLDVRPMSEPMKRVYDVTLPSGGGVRFHVMTGREEEALGKTNMPDDQLTMALVARIDMLDGKPPTVRDLKSMNSRDRDFLRDQFDTVEGGLDMGVDARCRLCGHDWSYDVDPGDQGFFFPSAALKRLKKKYS